MLTAEHIVTTDWEAALRGMRNAMSSWAQSDTIYHGSDVPEIGELDMSLAKLLIRAGTSDSKFMRVIGISMDIIAPEYWWSQFDTYKVGTVRNSCSKMHKLMAEPFTADMFSTDNLQTEEEGHTHFDETIRQLNRWRNIYNNTNDPEVNRQCWWNIMQQLPQSYNQRATVKFNYQVARKMYSERKHHKLTEWRQFCDVLEQLPYSELITLEAPGHGNG